MRVHGPGRAPHVCVRRRCRPGRCVWSWCCMPRSHVRRPNHARRPTFVQAPCSLNAHEERGLTILRPLLELHTQLLKPLARHLRSVTRQQWTLATGNSAIAIAVPGGTTRGPAGPTSRAANRPPLVTRVIASAPPVVQNIATHLHIRDRHTDVAKPAWVRVSVVVPLHSQREGKGGEVGVGWEGGSGRVSGERFGFVAPHMP